MKTRYSDDELAEFSAILSARIEKSESYLASIDEQLIELADNSIDENSLDDSSSLMEQKENLTSFRSRQIKHLSDLNAAMLRIKNKSYGICVVTGELIEKARLLAVPTTTKSIKSKTEIE